MNKKEIEKFDMHAKPIKTRWYLHLLLQIAVSISFIGSKYKIRKENFKKIKGGCLVIANHMSFADVKILQKVIFPRRSYYISSIDEFVKKEGLMRRLGCIPKKVHYTDMAIVRNIVRLLKKGNIVTIYPEATYTFAGVTNMFDQGLGKLAKMANVPVVVIHYEGNYIYSPRWNTHPINKEVPLNCSVKMVVNNEEVKKLSDVEIQNRINEYFAYNDYKYQRDNNIHIKSKTKANMIHRILYRCPNCLNEVCIEGKGNDIICNKCNANYHIDELSILKNNNGETKFDSIADWFLWQKEDVVKNIDNGTYSIDFPIRVSHLVNAKIGFDHNFAYGNAHQDEKGIVIDAITSKDKENFHFEYNEKLNSTVHLTYDVKGCQESAFEVHDANETYLIYPLDGTPIVKIRFAVEQSHIKYVSSLKIKN